MEASKKANKQTRKEGRKEQGRREKGGDVGRMIMPAASFLFSSLPPFLPSFLPFIPFIPFLPPSLPSFFPSFLPLFLSFLPSFRTVYPHCFQRHRRAQHRCTWHVWDVQKRRTFSNSWAWNKAAPFVTLKTRTSRRRSSCTRTNKSQRSGKRARFCFFGKAALWRISRPFCLPLMCYLFSIVLLLLFGAEP